MGNIRVWTKQHGSVLDELEATGRYTVRREYVEMDLQEHAPLVLEVYDWLARHGPDAANRPADVELPVWVSYACETAMRLSGGTVLLELELPAERVTPVNIAKWGAILNYSYLPADDADARRHRALLEQYGVSDAKAYMTQFYPELRREIVESWERLFDEGVRLGSDACYGNLWEIRKEWVKQITR